MEFYAHSKADKPTDEWQSLDDHLTEVASLAAQLARIIESSDWAFLIGLLHDIGKAHPDFQSYLMKVNGLDSSDYDHAGTATHPNHSGVGAILAYEQCPNLIGKTIAYIIAGHHAGLPDWFGGRDSLLSRINEEKSIVNETVRGYARSVLNLQLSKLVLPAFAMQCNNSDAIAYHFWVRMLFSCLVDADFLNTEAFMNKNRHALRPSFPTLLELKQRFDTKIQTFIPNTYVNRIRAEILSHCRNAAKQQPGLFALTVPTGGGKTLSAMAFALDHATIPVHNKDRIIYVIPYTSIIEQTAETLRQYFGPENVIEHHSNIMPEKETPSHTLAAENWDAPIIVTTSVQFFESLYAARPGRCRKLHNIANSVVILDEAQLLPPELLYPCVEALNRLISDYKVTVVLSTATQPALPNLCCKPSEIIPAGANLYKRLKRTHIDFPEHLDDPVDWPSLADSLYEHDQVLCIVNTRKDCYSLWKEMPNETIHLSALMCGEHRSQIIAHIKKRLLRGETCRVISTQLVEAGVDIDFPVVYRAMAGIDSINQAAGRCNREGARQELGKVHVFIPPKPSPPGLLRKGEDTTRMLASIPEFLPDSPDTYRRYFEGYYASINDIGMHWWRDILVKNVNPNGNVQFRTAGKDFQLIKELSIPIIVHFSGNDETIKALHDSGPNREIMRALQRYTVSVRQDIADHLLAEGRIEELYDGIFVQVDTKLYNPRIGLDIFSETYAPEDLQF